MRRVVHRVNFVEGKARFEAVREHGVCTAGFLRGLEHQHERAAKLAMCAEMTRGAKQHCRVAVVSAAVKNAVAQRPMQRRSFFLHRQCVHVRA